MDATQRAGKYKPREERAANYVRWVEALEVSVSHKKYRRTTYGQRAVAGWDMKPKGGASAVAEAI